jgi:thiol-disulfide isomerase/thioredoxin
MKNYLKVLISMFLVCTLSSCNQVLQEKQAELSSNQEQNNPLTRYLANSNKAAVIKFYAEWCSSCKQYTPKFNAVSKKLSDKVDFFSIDVDDPEYKELVKYAKISRIPDTFFVSKDRQNVARKLGPITANKLESIVNDLLSK